MKRSEINRIMRDALAFLDAQSFRLPPFATWTPDQWRDKGPEAHEIVEQQLGWDITDFGSGAFERVGLFLFTIRNGTLADLKNPLGKHYGEKVLITGVGQVTPTHYHHQKMEDIINRGGGELVIQLWNATEDGAGLADSEVTVSCDGVRRRLPAGGTLRLAPGESVTLPQRLWHKFWAEGAPVLVGEVSRVNDDHTDNKFHEPVGRFPVIEADEPPLHLLYNDYTDYYPHA
ncbi:MAG: D-lyxose/D-mannose family sugar isomerase [Phycisphaeraceae bacterium]